MDGQHDTERGPSWVHTSQLAFMRQNRVSNVHNFSYNYFVLGKMNKAKLSTPSDTIQLQFRSVIR